MVFRRHTLRQWASRVLLAWLFGVAAGVANACLLVDDADGHAVVHAHAQAQVHVQGHDDEGLSAKANCLDFCEKSAVAIPGVKVIDKVSAALPPLLAGVSALPSPATREKAAEPAWPPDGPNGPPIPIAFLRLAL